MFVPNIYLKRVTDITPEILQKLNIKGLILDVDNTLSTHHGMRPVDNLFEWISEMQTANIPLIILSNSKEKRVKPFANMLGLNFLSLGLKPLPFGYLRAAKRLNLKLNEVAIAGDQIFTDVLGAKLARTKVILLEPILLEDKLSFKIRRSLERKLLSKYKRKGVI